MNPYRDFTSEDAEYNSDENHNVRLKALDLKYGSTAVFKDRKGRFWATGDYKFNADNVDHNIRRMVEIMLAENLTYMGKGYRSDIYKSKIRINDKDWADIFSLHSTDHVTEVDPELPIVVEAG